MTRVALKGLAWRKIRGALTAIAIVLGVAMVSGAFILTDTMQNAANTLQSDAYEGIDAVVTGKALFDSDEDWEQTPPISDGVIGKAARVPEVLTAHGLIVDQGKLVDSDGEVIGSPPNFAIGVNGTAPGADRLNPLSLTTGRWPRGPDEIAIDVGTSKRSNFAVGDEIGVVPRGQIHRAKIVGLLKIGSVESIGTATLAAFDLGTAQEMFDKPGQVDQVVAAGRTGVDEDELLAAIGSALPPGLQVQTADEADPFDFSGLKEFVKFIRIFLLSFGGLALFVGAFIIFNTFSITVAQRAREFALLRTIGASRRQVLGSVVLEALMIGLAATAVGIALGVGIAAGLNALLKALNLDLPQTGMVFSGRTVIVSLIVGVVVTVIAGLIPAVRATRVPPVAVMREGATLPRSRFSGAAPVIAIGAIVVGAGALVYGMFADDISAWVRVPALLLGVLVLFVGVALLAPRLVRPLASVMGLPAARLAGAPGRLARQNATRNPGRTATTAAALMIGVALVTFVSVLADGMRDSWGSTVDKQVNADYVITTEEGWDSFSPASSDTLGAVPGVRAVAAVRRAQARALDETTGVTGLDPSIAQFFNFDWVSGSDQVVNNLGVNGAIVLKEFAEDHDLQVGDTFTLTTSDNESRNVVVRGIHKPIGLDTLLSDVSVSTGAFDSIFERPRNAMAFVEVVPGTDRAILESALKAYPDVNLQDEGEFVETQNAWIDQTLSLLYALLGLSVIVSFFGIVNTLVLSVVERTRELGMLRAVGMTKRQVRRMVRHESVITALIGAALGIVLGIGLAALVTKRLSDYSESVGGEGMSLSLPLFSLAVFIVVAVIAGVLAAIMPARRASRLNVLEALAYE
jgi:putative ABC transport system permease protein